MRNNKIRAMSMGAMIAAIYGVLFFVDMNFANSLAYALYFILPVLIIFYICHFSMKQAVVLGVVIFFVTLFTTTPFSLFYALTSVIAGLAIGYAHIRHVSGNKMLLISTSISLINNILSYTVLSKVLEMNLIDEMREIYEMIISSKVLQGVFQWSISIDTFIKYGPLLVIFMGIIEGYLLVMCCSLILPRLKIKFTYHFNFLEMQLPKWIGIIGLACYIGHFLIQSIYFDYLYFILFFLIVLQGFSLVALYLLGKRKVLFYFIACIGCLVPYWNDVYFILGIIDIVIGFRKKIMYNGHN